MAAFSAIGTYLRGLDGWRARGFAFLAGGLSALGFAPIDAFPVLLLGYAALVILIDGAASSARPMRNAAWLGWAFAFGQFAVGWHWIVYAFLVDPGEHAWQIPFILLLPAFLALYWAGAGAAAARFWTQGPSRIFVFALAATIAEWLRGHLLTGFPWNIAAYGWGASLSIMQSAALFGAYGLSFLTILFGASLAELFGARAAWRLPLAMTILFAALLAGGAVRLSAGSVADVPGVRLRIVQPNIAQSDKYRPELVDRNWNRLIDLSALPASRRPTLLIWPEAAPPFVLTRSAEALDEIALLTGRDRTLMTGALRALRSGERIRYFNSFYVFGHGGQLVGVYDKFHLVPFGEYLPF
jgi:apolipoprotein N-acyltransferase